MATMDFFNGPFQQDSTGAAQCQVAGRAFVYLDGLEFGAFNGTINKETVCLFFSGNYTHVGMLRIRGAQECRQLIILRPAKQFHTPKVHTKG
jgi:hypothetical protein